MHLNFLKSFIVDDKRKETNFEQKILDGIKLHTIRADVTNRWHPDMKIHFATGSRTNNYNCFKEGKCYATQNITIQGRCIYIDGRSKPLTDSKVEWLAINDGFDTVQDFWAWFDQYAPFTVKIIHWSEISY